MRSIVATAFLTTVLAAWPALAQEASEPPAEESAAATEPAPAPAATPGTGQAATSRDQAAVGEPYIRDVFTDWTVRCIRLEQQEDLCEMHQSLADPDGTRTAEFNLFPLNRGQIAAGGTIVTPLETVLTENVVLSIDGGEARAYPFTFCNRVGCVAQVGFLETEINQFRRGRTAVVRIVPLAAPDQTVTLNVSLSGFTAAYASLAE